MFDIDISEDESNKNYKQPLNFEEIQRKLFQIVTKKYHFQPPEVIEIQSPRQPKSPVKKSDNQKQKSEQKMQLVKQSIWVQLKKEFHISQQASINMLYINEDLILSLIKILSSFTFQQKSKEIISDLVRKIDPSLRFLKILIRPLIQVLENSGHQLNTLNTILYALKVLFQQQTPINEQIDSYIELYGGQGIKCDHTSRWPFQKSGTITLWFSMYKTTQECKLFEIKNSEGIGFQINQKNGKFYFQKVVQQKKFRLMANNVAYLCDCQWQKSVKFSIDFQIKKKFFQPIFSINVSMNNFMMTNIEVDSLNFNMNDFKISLFKNYFGKVYSALVLKSNLSRIVQELSTKGFIYENDIKNFGSIFESEVKNVLFLYSSIRAITVYEYDYQVQNKVEDVLSEPKFKVQNSDPQTKLQFIQDSQRSSNQGSPQKNTQKDQIPIYSFNFLYPTRQPQYVLLFDPVNRNNAKIIAKGNIYRNISIKKELANYGGLKSFLPFLELLKLFISQSEQFKTALNEYLLLIKSIFLNKTEAFQEAYKIHFFEILAKFFDQIELQGFDVDIICSLKEVYVTLNTRMMRQSFVKQLVWGIKTAVYLEETKFQAYLKFIKSFYNEDIQSMLVTFGIKDIINFILDNYDQPNCCFEHTRASIAGNDQKRIKNYFKIVKDYFTLLENILLIKRNQSEELEILMKQILTVFTLNTSACFIEAFVLFLSELFNKDSYLQKKFIELMNSQNYKLSVYMCLAYSYSWKTKTKLIELVLHIFGPTIIKQFSDEEKDEKHFISLCIKFPVIMHIPMRASSINSQDREYSIDQSEDKLSMNSTNLKRYTVMKTIDQQDIQSLLNEQDIARVILQWSFSQQVVQKMEENQNAGISILMEIYKGSTYKIRKYITNLLLLNQKLLSLGSAIMPSFVQCLFVCEWDLQFYFNKDEIIYTQINQTKKNVLQLICSYKTDYESNELPQLLILKLIIASVKSKFSSDVSKLSNRIYLLISDAMFKRYLQDLKKQEWKEQQKFNLQCQKIIYNAYKTLVEYFCERGQSDQMQFQEESIQMAEKQYRIMISVLQKILELFLYITAPTPNSTVMSDSNSRRNKFIASILFPDKKQGHISFFSFVFVILQTIFQNFQDLNITQRKTVLTLLKKYIIYMVQLTQNSNDLLLEPIQQDLKNNFFIPLAFLQNKFYQYFYYGFEKHKNLGFSVENRIRKNVEDMKCMIFNIFLDLIQMVKQIDQIGSMEHKSFYELMKPKRKNSQKTSIKNFYPQLWKKNDDKIIQFMCLPTKILKQEAREKLQTHLIQKRLSLISSSIQKLLTKKIQGFITYEKKNKAAIEQKSVYSYITRQSLKCKKLCETEEQITVLKYQHGQKQKIQQIKRREKQQKAKRQINNIKRKIWNQNRCFGGLWSNYNIFQFTQNNNKTFGNNPETVKTDCSIQSFYKRVRSNKQSKFLLRPLIQIIALPIQSEQQKSFQEIYLSEITNSQRQQSQTKEQTLKSQKYLKIGLAFIKKKVIQKIMKKGIGLGLGIGSQNTEEPSSKNDKFFTKGALWIKPMLVCHVNIQMNQKSLIMYRQSSHSYQHLSLLKNQQTEFDLLLKQFKIKDIQSYQLRTFMLKPTAIQIFFYSRKSLFLSLYGKSETIFNKFLEFLTKFRKLQIKENVSMPLRIIDPSKNQDKYFLTQKWINRQISNLEYLMSLNILSGRSNCDLNQYFVFPWILRSYAKGKQQFRDLSLNMGSLGSKERLQKFRQIKNSIQLTHKDQFPQAHNFGFHYSNIAIVLQYLIRVNPYSEGAKYLQGGKFDIPDRLFCSIVESYANSTNQMSDIREIIPEFYYFPEFLINSQNFQFGVQQNSRKVHHIQLPEGYQNAYEFIQRHHELLESQNVSLNLNNWIDLIFGFAQLGKQAQNANNKYHYLAYEHNHVHVAVHQDGTEQKQSMQSHMAYFGKVPSQLFLKPHPKRPQFQGSIIKQLPKIKTAQPFKNFGETINFQSQMIKHLNGYFSSNPQNPIFFYYSQSTKKYLILRRNGQGIIFNIERTAKSNKQIVLHKPNTSMNVQKSFSFFVDKIENMYMFDESIYFQSLPVACFWTESLFFGGIWDGKILRYDIKTQKFNTYAKHSAPVTAFCSSEQLQILISGSINGQVVIWNFEKTIFPNQNQSKLLFKNKCVIHHDQINRITINTDLGLSVISSRDGFVSLIDINKWQPVRVIKLQIPVLNSILISYPYYCLFIECAGNRQFCYSLNGQLLNEYNYQNLVKYSCPIKVYHKELIVLKQRDRNYFQMIQLPKLKIKQKIMINEEDNTIQNFIPTFMQNKVQILMNNEKLMVHCTHPFQTIFNN